MGLNTAIFAKRLFQPSDVADLQPDLMLLFTGSRLDCIPQEDWRTPYAVRSYEHLARNLVQGAAANDYELWLTPFGNTRFMSGSHLASRRDNQECWYIRRRSSIHAELEGILSKHGASAQNGLLALPK